jgi:acetate---CoA ligase (ADP-forming)
MASLITAERLTSLLRPRSVALVGASDKSAFSLLAYRNLVEFGFAAHTYLVARRGAEVHGRPAVTSCAQIGEPVDVAYLMVPQAGIPAALEDAAAAGIRNACVLSSGYAEAGEAGRAAQDELARHAAGLGMVLLGPNHLGFANFTDGVPVCSIPGLPRVPGPVALLSQSGASSSAMLDFAAMVNVGLSYLVTLGNEAMITAGTCSTTWSTTRARGRSRSSWRPSATPRRSGAPPGGPPRRTRPSWSSRPAAARCPPAPRPRTPAR